MGATWKDVVGFAKEDGGYGIAVPATAWARFKGNFDFSHKPDHIRLSGTDELRSYQEFVRGNISVEGSISDLEIQLDHFIELLEAVLGDKAAYVFLVKNDVLPSLTFEISYGGLLYQYVGVKVKSLTFDAEAGSLMKASLEFVGQKGRDLGALTARSYSTLKPVVCHGVTLQWNNGAIRAQKASVKISNDLRYPFWELGSMYSAEPSEGLVEVTGDIRALWDSKAEFDNFVVGDQKNIIITGTSPDGDSIIITMSQVKLKNFSKERGDQDYDQTLQYEAVYDVTLTSPIKVEITGLP